MQQVKCFKDLPLSRNVLSGLEELGFEDLFPIQAQAIMPLLEGKDVIGQAQTGTGKTAAFGVPMVERLDFSNRTVQGLILTPTRELALQVADHIRRIGRYTPLKVLAVYGGVSIERQMESLRRGVHVVVGTPGRIIDHINRETLDLSSVRMVVLDEADRMLDMGFREDVEYILSRVPAERQTSLFSATIDRNVMSLCDKYMHDPEKILVSRDTLEASGITQYYVRVNSRNKFRVLLKILMDNKVGKAIIFCRTRKGASILANKLKLKGYDARPLHGGFTQAQRETVLNSFRTGRTRLLVATDVAARGLDIQGVTHIINYDVPLDTLVYFHRIGRTARMGGEGVAITLVDYRETEELNRIKALITKSITELEAAIETYKAVCAQCGRECQVPFKPRRGKPIYCPECWERIKPPVERLA
ncbi:DEAD/DEAH box helicase [Candidatus Bathyarchaeota archaeon]|nr:DEAD/DEAH box helicase [Candidatus Bathyarchaeota archaeon]